MVNLNKCPLHSRFIDTTNSQEEFPPYLVAYVVKQDKLFSVEISWQLVAILHFKAFMDKCQFTC